MVIITIVKTTLHVSQTEEEEEEGVVKVEEMVEKKGKANSEKNVETEGSNRVLVKMPPIHALKCFCTDMIMIIFINFRNSVNLH